MDSQKVSNPYEVKCSFFSAYQFSHVCFEGISNSVWHTSRCLVFGYYVDNGDKGRIYVKDATPLLLKPVSKITDADREYCISIGRSHSCQNFQQNQVDYLRSKGYALPFMEYSVEDLVSFGWVKLL
jgi:hypothetical protein